MYGTTNSGWDEGDGSVEGFGSVWLWMGQRGGGFKARDGEQNVAFEHVSNYVRR